jgi:hypothetical protein
LLVLWAACPGVAGVTRAEEPTPVFEAARIEQPPVIDGRLSDACWQKVPPLTNFLQVLPVAGAPPTEDTEVRLVYTPDCLYVGIRCYDSAPGRIIAKQMRHDAWLQSDDYVKVAFDTFRQQREGYYFVVNPAGARAEGLIEDFYHSNSLWDAVWQARAQVDERGWTAELAIPFRSLCFDPGARAWGCNVERVIRRKQETVRWTAISPAKPMSSLTDFGELRGLSGLRQGLGLEFKPFTSVKYREDRLAGAEDWDCKPGFDLTYRITPSLTAQGTLNTDFAETEVDERMVNLTRFPLFFPEKRYFFLQDADIYRFGGLDYTPLPYYSRRIGLSAEGEPVDIMGGVRLTGRIGRTSVGLLDVQQDEHQGSPAQNLAVLRLAHQLMEDSNLGLMVTHGNPQASGDNTLAGVDFNYLNNQFRNDKQLIGHAYFMGTRSDRLDGADFAFGGDLDYPNEPIDVHLFFRQIGEKFDPALGFVERQAIRDYVGSARYIWRPNWAWLRHLSAGVHPRLTTGLDNRIVAEDFDLPTLFVQSPSGHYLSADCSFNRDVVDAPYEMWPGVMIPAGDHRWNGFRIGLQTTQAKPVSVQFGWRTGSYYEGTQQSYGGGMDWRPSRHFTTGWSYVLRQIDLPQGVFEVRTGAAWLNLAFTPDLAWSTFVQYDNQSGELGFNSRFRWTFRPGSDLFLGGYAQ